MDASALDPFASVQACNEPPKDVLGEMKQAQQTNSADASQFHGMKVLANFEMKGWAKWKGWWVGEMYWNDERKTYLVFAGEDGKKKAKSAGLKYWKNILALTNPAHADFLEGRLQNSPVDFGNNILNPAKARDVVEYLRHGPDSDSEATDDEVDAWISVKAKDDETCSQIAAEQGFKAEDLVRLNQSRFPTLSAHAKLKEGTEILIPKQDAIDELVLRDGNFLKQGKFTLIAVGQHKRILYVEKIQKTGVVVREFYQEAEMVKEIKTACAKNPELQAEVLEGVAAAGLGPNDFVMRVHPSEKLTQWPIRQLQEALVEPSVDLRFSRMGKATADLYVCRYAYEETLFTPERGRLKRWRQLRNWHLNSDWSACYKAMLRKFFKKFPAAPKADRGSTLLDADPIHEELPDFGNSNGSADHTDADASSSISADTGRGGADTEQGGPARVMKSESPAPQNTPDTAPKLPAQPREGPLVLASRPGVDFWAVMDGDGSDAEGVETFGEEWKRKPQAKDDKATLLDRGGPTGMLDGKRGGEVRKSETCGGFPGSRPSASHTPQREQGPKMQRGEIVREAGRARGGVCMAGICLQQKQGTYVTSFYVPKSMGGALAGKQLATGQTSDLMDAFKMRRAAVVQRFGKEVAEAQFRREEERWRKGGGGGGEGGGGGSGGGGASEKSAEGRREGERGGAGVKQLAKHGHRETGDGTDSSSRPSKAAQFAEDGWRHSDSDAASEPRQRSMSHDGCSSKDKVWDRSACGSDSAAAQRKHAASSSGGKRSREEVLDMAAAGTAGAAHKRSCWDTQGGVRRQTADGDANQQVSAGAAGAVRHGLESPKLVIPDELKDQMRAQMGGSTYKEFDAHLHAGGGGDPCLFDVRPALEKTFPDDETRAKSFFAAIYNASKRANQRPHTSPAPQLQQPRIQTPPIQPVPLGSPRPSPAPPLHHRQPSMTLPREPLPHQREEAAGRESAAAGAGGTPTQAMGPAASNPPSVEGSDAGAAGVGGGSAQREAAPGPTPAGAGGGGAAAKTGLVLLGARCERAEQELLGETFGGEAVKKRIERLEIELHESVQPGGIAGRLEAIEAVLGL